MLAFLFIILDISLVFLVIVYNSSQWNLSVICQPSVGCLSADCQPTDCPTVGHLLANCWPFVCHLSVDHGLTFIRQMADKFGVKNRTTFARLLAIFQPTVSDVRYLNNIGVIKTLRTRVWIGAPGQKLYLENKTNYEPVLFCCIVCQKSLLYSVCHHYFCHSIYYSN